MRLSLSAGSGSLPLSCCQWRRLPGPLAVARRRPAGPVALRLTGTQWQNEARPHVTGAVPARRDRSQTQGPARCQWAL